MSKRNNGGLQDLFYSLVVDWTEADLNASLQSIVRNGQGFSRLEESSMSLVLFNWKIELGPKLSGCMDKSL